MSLMMETLPRRHRITVDEYYRMAEVGLLAPDARVELIEGDIIEMVPIGPPHSVVVSYLTEQLVSSVRGRAVVRVQDALRLDRYSQPQPDFVLVKPPLKRYGARHPGPGDTLLVIEVSNSSIRFDRDVKVPLYARHQIPEVWLVDLEQKCLVGFRAPVDGAYTQTSTVRQPATAPIAELPGVTVDLTDLLSL